MNYNANKGDLGSNQEMGDRNANWNAREKPSICQ